MIAIGVYERDIKWVILLKKLKYKSLKLEESVKDKSNLMLETNLLANLCNC